MNNQTKRNFNIFRANNTFNSSPKNIDYEFEYDKNKEIIIKLKEQIIAKDKEILDLKTTKNKKEEEYGKAIYLFQEIVNSSNKNEENSKKKNKKKKNEKNEKDEKKDEKKEKIKEPMEPGISYSFDRFGKPILQKSSFNFDVNKIQNVNQKKNR